MRYTWKWEKVHSKQRWRSVTGNGWIWQWLRVWVSLKIFSEWFVFCFSQILDFFYFSVAVKQRRGIHGSGMTIKVPFRYHTQISLSSDVLYVIPKIVLYWKHIYENVIIDWRQRLNWRWWEWPSMTTLPFMNKPPKASKDKDNLVNSGIGFVAECWSL